MKWRNIGPYRAGKVNAVSGIPGDPATFYFGASGGGVWKTSDSGTTWKPLFDSENVSSIGAMAVSLSNPKVIYVGTGENDITSEVAFGDGVYKSTDGGATWKHVGLEDTQHIARVRVDPRNPEIVLAAAMGHTFDANQERGIFRSTDGGRTWKKTLYKDDVTGAVDICLAPDDAHIVYASLWQAVYRPSDPEARFGAGSGIYKSTDEGATWKQVGGKGLPSEPLGRIGVAVAPGTHGRKVFAIIEGKEKGSGLYVTADGGETWQRATTDERIVGFWYMSEIFIDPKDANVVYVPLQSLYKSADGGKTFTVLKGAPGGDDYHTMWIDPINSNHIMLGVDQGATISLNGGADLEHLVQPADGAVLPCGDRPLLAVLDLWAAAGQRHGGHREPRKRWADHGTRLVPSWVGRKRVHDPGSGRSGCCVQRRAGGIDGPRVEKDRTGAGYIACADPVRNEVPAELEHAAGVLAAGPAPALCRYAISDADDGWRDDVEGDQPGPDAHSSGREEPEEDGIADDGCAFAGAGRRDLDRLERRVRAGNSRWRSDVEERDARGGDALERDSAD
ncbi:MAG TPA: hypothetical protein VGL89_14605 [Candidatus Koribacter sp.]